MRDTMNTNPFANANMIQHKSYDQLERENAALRRENERLRGMAYLTIKLPHGLRWLSSRSNPQ